MCASRHVSWCSGTHAQTHCPTKISRIVLRHQACSVACASAVSWPQHDLLLLRPFWRHQWRARPVSTGDRAEAMLCQQALLCVAAAGSLGRSVALAWRTFEGHLDSERCTAIVPFLKHAVFARTLLNIQTHANILLEKGHGEGVEAAAARSKSLPERRAWCCVYPLRDAATEHCALKYASQIKLQIAAWRHVEDRAWVEMEHR